MIDVKPLISINAFSKARLKEMILNLIPKVGYVRIRKDGMIILKTKWFSLKRTKIHTSDLCESELPRQISDMATSKGLGIGYERIFNDYITEAKQLRYYVESFDIIDYLWDNYVKLCINLPTIYVDSKSTLMIEQSDNKKNLPIISPTTLNMGYVLTLANDIKRISFNEINKKINEIIGKSKNTVIVNY